VVRFFLREDLAVIERLQGIRTLEGTCRFW